MARRKVRINRLQNRLLRRIDQLRAQNAANRELEVTIILHDLIVGSRRVQDLPLDELVHVSALVDHCIKSSSDRLTEMAAAQEPPAVADAPAPSGGGEPRQ